MRTVLTAAAACLVCLTLAAQDRPRRSRGAPAVLAHGTFTTKTFASAALKNDVPYGIYLPNSYSEEGNADKRYPLVVWLHGMFEDHERFHERGGSAVLDEMVGKGSVPELILVAPYAGNSFYINGVETGACEDAVAVDLLAHMDKEYRVASERGQRAIMGVSMGGYGALKIALKHPECYGAVAAHSPAVLPLDPKELGDRFPWLERWGGGQKALGKIFGDPIDLDRWRAENVLALAEEMDVESLAGLKIYFDCGAADRYGFAEPNAELHAVLERRKVPHVYREIEGGNHGWASGYNQTALPESLAFVAAAWTASAGTAGLEGALAPQPERQGKSDR